MSEPHWMVYVGAVAGFIGGIAGIAGAWLGWVAYRRSDQIKALDLRLALRKAINEIEQIRAIVKSGVWRVDQAATCWSRSFI